MNIKKRGRKLCIVDIYGTEDLNMQEAFASLKR
jgi:hypothetical protein